VWQISNNCHSSFPVHHINSAHQNIVSKIQFNIMKRDTADVLLFTIETYHHNNIIFFSVKRLLRRFSLSFALILFLDFWKTNIHSLVIPWLHAPFLLCIKKCKTPLFRFKAVKSNILYLLLNQYTELIMNNSWVTLFWVYTCVKQRNVDIWTKLQSDEYSTKSLLGGVKEEKKTQKIWIVF